MKQIQYIFLLVIVFFLFHSCSVNTDDSKELLNKAESYITNKPDSALFYIGSIISPQLLSDNDYAKYAVLLVRTHNHNNLPTLNDTIINFAINYYKKDNDEVNLARTYLQAGRVYEDRKMYDDAKKLYLDAIELSKKHNMTGLFAMTMLEIADLSFWINDYKESLNWFSRSIDYYPHISEKQVIQKKIADCHSMLGQLDTADSIYNDIEKTFKLENNNQLADIYKSKALILFKKGKYNSANNLLDKAIILSDNKKLLSVFYLLKSEINEHQKEFNNANKNLQKAINLAAEVKRLDIIDRINRSQAKDKEYLKVPDDICWYVNIGGEYNKSRYTTITALRGIYNAHKAQIQTQALALENQRYTIIIITILLCFTIIVFLSIWYRKYMVEKHQLKIENMNEQFEKKEDSLNERINYFQDSLSDKLLLYRRLVVMSLFKNKKSSQLLIDINRIVYNKKGDSIFDWDILIDLLNIVYDNFQIKLSGQYGQILSPKEIEVILLQKARFEINEICEILELTPTTIYHRNSDIRKKLDLKPAQNIIDFLDQNIK